MRLSLLLNIIGLAISTAGALLMFYFPPRPLMVTEKGEKALTFVSNPDPASAPIGKRQTRLSRLGPAMLALGFIVQMTAFLPFGEPSFTGTSEQAQGRVWVLWVPSVENASGYEAAAGYETKLACQAETEPGKKFAGSLFGRIAKCLPDTVDPRGPKRGKR